MTKITEAAFSSQTNPDVTTAAIIDVEDDYTGRSYYQPVYLGTAPPGTDPTVGIWNVRKLTYDGSSRLTLIQNATGPWVDRTTLPYD